MLKLRNWIPMAAAAGLALFAATPADAGLKLRLEVNGTLIGEFVDNGTGDTNSDLGFLQVDVANFVNNNVAVAAFFNFAGLSASSSNAPTLPPSNARLVTATNVASLAGGSVNITTTDTDFTLPANPGLMATSLAGTYSEGPGTADLQSFYNPSNVEFATDVAGTPVGGVLTFDLAGSIGGPAFEADDAIAPPVIPFGLTHVLEFTFSAGGSIAPTATTAIGGAAVVPEPATLAAVLTGLPLIGLALRRRRKVA